MCRGVWVGRAVPQASPLGELVRWSGERCWERLMERMYLLTWEMCLLTFRPAVLSSAVLGGGLREVEMVFVEKSSNPFSSLTWERGLGLLCAYFIL